MVFKRARFFLLQCKEKREKKTRFFFFTLFSVVYFFIFLFSSAFSEMKALLPLGLALFERHDRGRDRARSVVCGSGGSRSPPCRSGGPPSSGGLELADPPRVPFGAPALLVGAALQQGDELVAGRQGRCIVSGGGRRRGSGGGVGRRGGGAAGAR